MGLLCSVVRGQPGKAAAHPGATTAYLGAVEVHQGALEALPKAIDCGVATGNNVHTRVVFTL
jgi:hypothetical protein